MLGVSSKGGADAERGGLVMPFRIKFVEDKDLPKNVDWAIARDERGQMFFVKQSRICPDVLAEAWAAADQLATRMPDQRTSV